MLWWLILLIPLFILLTWVLLAGSSWLWVGWQRRLARDHRLGPKAATPEEVGRTLERVWTAAQAWNGLDEARSGAEYFAPILETYREPLTVELRRRASSGNELARMTAELLGLSLGEA